ncbi:MAG: TatD family hydrolase [Candidatus Sungbacteria bacterium]|nr:TatD family hydrolase [Candidatus Sungbacteria bacterium]
MHESISPLLFDVHTHTQFAAFAENQDAVIRRALERQVWIVNVGTQKDTSAAAVETAHHYAEGVYATVGLHPIHTDKSHHDKEELGGEQTFVSRGEEFDYAYYKKLLQNPKVVAIGECGLDYYRLGEQTKQKQFAVFGQQIALASEVRKPLMIHCRNAFADLIDVLNGHRSAFTAPPGIIHFFTGTVDDAKTLLDLGFSFSFGGVITFARDYDDMVRYIPLERIVLETDAPYITPVPYRGKRNEPAYMIEIARKLAEIKKLPFETAARVTTQNARALFAC